MLCKWTYPTDISMSFRHFFLNSPFPYCTEIHRDIWNTIFANHTSVLTSRKVLCVRCTLKLGGKAWVKLKGMCIRRTISYALPTQHAVGL